MIGVVALVIGMALDDGEMPSDDATEKVSMFTSFAAVSGEIGAQDISGPYNAADWPKDVSTLPGQEDWTWGAAQGIFAENPSRVYLLARGGLPNLEAPPTTKLPGLCQTLPG